MYPQHWKVDDGLIIHDNHGDESYRRRRGWTEIHTGVLRGA